MDSDPLNPKAAENSQRITPSRLRERQLGEPPLTGRARVLEDRAEHLPALAVELHHLQLLVDAVVVRRGVADNSGQREVELDILQVGRLFEDVLAGQIVAALLQD